MLRLLTANWELKIVAAVMAFTLWLFVATSDHTLMALAAPVEYAGIAPELVLLGGERESVDVEVRAVRAVAARLGPETLRVRVSLAGLEAGETMVEITSDQVDVPPGATVTRIAPARLRVVLAPAGAASVKIVPQLRGTPAPGFTVHRVVVDPPAVKIKGPRSTIESRGEVTTLPIDVSGSRRTITQSVGLMLPASTYLTRERTVQVTVEIAEDGMQQQPSRDSRRKGAGR